LSIDDLFQRMREFALEPPEYLLLDGPNRGSEGKVL
jgi:hypothetical protein